MKILNKKIITLFICFFVVSCGNQPQSSHKKDISNDIKNPKQQSSPHFECHPSEYKFNTLPPIPSVPENAIGVMLADEQINNAPFNCRNQQCCLHFWRAEIGRASCRERV